ncbi:IclR family transcriptional regulator [Pseudonocardia pini]|uniref:IclR family transcriptional regulator n=1 Tax=Pseudonocardia pini TaxID=2758030 RepID=UPI0015F0B281|nr:IclR family transcriptional regulator [Pseudonocardia pini]
MATPERTRSGTLESGLDVIELLARTQRPLGVSEIAVELGADKGNLHRLLGVLTSRGYVRKDEHSRRYEVTPRLVALSGSVLRNLDLVTAATPVCNELVATIHESIHAAQVAGREVVYVLQRRAAMRVSVNTDIGARAPLHCTATGKAVLAQLPEDQLGEWVQEPFEPHTRRTYATLEQLREDLALVRERGYAIDDEELTPDVRCVAAPVFAIDGRVYGCLGISGPEHRMGVSEVVRIASAVLWAARETTRGLGGPVERYDSYAIPATLTG